MKKIPKRFLFVICHPNCRLGDEIHNRLMREVSHLVHVFKKEINKDVIPQPIVRKILKEKINIPVVVWDDETFVFGVEKPNMFNILEHVTDKIINDRQNYLEEKAKNELSGIFK